jgi:predicted nucleic acid-binding protein
MEPQVSARVYLDTNVFIAAFEMVGDQSDQAWHVLDAIDGGELRGMTSELTLAEVLIRPMQDGDDELVQRYQSIISQGEGFEVVAVSRGILIEAAILRTVRRSLRLPDAIHVATARLGDCRFLVSDDRRLSFSPGVRVVSLNAHSLDVIRSASQ